MRYKSESNRMVLPGTAAGTFSASPASQHSFHRPSWKACITGRCLCTGAGTRNTAAGFQPRWLPAGSCCRYPHLPCFPPDLHLAVRHLAPVKHTRLTAMQPCCLVRLYEHASLWKHSSIVKSCIVDHWTQTQKMMVFTVPDLAWPCHSFSGLILVLACCSVLLYSPGQGRTRGPCSQRCPDVSMEVTGA